MAFYLINTSVGDLQVNLNTPAIGSRKTLNGKHHRALAVILKQGSKLDLCTYLNVSEKEASNICKTSPEIKRLAGRLALVDTRNPKPLAVVDQSVKRVKEEPIEVVYDLDNLDDKLEELKKANEQEEVVEVAKVVTEEKFELNLVEPEVLNELPEGSPNEDWTKKDISKWAKAYDIKISNRSSKKKLLNIVSKYLDNEQQVSRTELL